ncbi:hypothetical protein E6D34_26095 [Escherichia coli]|uniref:Uncharacterized protein n=1 Tax=Escherichia coli TaxID=562 RepID=A0A8S7K0Q8_ECOLX|nr:hypothetical protein [Escherichia coli]
MNHRGKTLPHPTIVQRQSRMNLLRTKRQTCTQGKNTQQQRMDLKTTKSEGKRINKTPETHPDNANQTCSLTTSLNRGCEMTR